MPDHETGTLLGLTANIVASHLSHNEVSSEALPGLIQSVYRSLSTVGKPTVQPEITPTPAVPVKKSVFPDFIVCLEDGKKLKMLMALPGLLRATVPSVDDCSRTAPPRTPSGVAGMLRNQWLASVGITGWNGSESPAALRRNAPRYGAERSRANMPGQNSAG